MKNTTKKREFDVDKESVKILRVAAFCFSIVSWLATAEGLANYVFDNDWRVYVISFAIQSILFIFNLQLPVYWEKLQLKRLKALFLVLYISFLFASSVFSFVYICTNAVYMPEATQETKSGCAAPSIAEGSQMLWMRLVFKKCRCSLLPISELCAAQERLRQRRERNL